MILWRNPPLLDEESITWLFDVFAWASRNFNRNFRLICPSNDDFPGRETSREGLASLVFSKVQEYTGMEKWPFTLTPLEQMPQSTASLSWDGGVVLNQSTAKLPVPYNPTQVGNPQALIASLAHALAMYYGTQAREAPPGGEKNWPHTTEVLAVYMGFGIMFANTAYNVRVTSCGSCQGPANDRFAYLSQYDICYALAIYSVLNDVHIKQVRKYLKTSLHSYFKKAVKDVHRRQSELKRVHSDSFFAEDPSLPGNP